MRVILLAVTSYLLIWFVMETERVISIFFMSAVLILQVISLIHYLNRVNRDLANFLIFLQEDDTTLAYSKQRVERNFGNVIIDLDKIVKKLHQAGVEKVQQQHFLNAIVEQVNVGLIAFTKQGKIDLINQAAKNLFGINRNDKISDLTNKFPELLEVFDQISGTTPMLVKIIKDGQLIHLAAKTTKLRYSDEDIFLISFDDIRSELESQEIDAWRKLIRILRHEIMNSITPILTLTTAIRRGFISDGNVKPIEKIKNENISDAIESAKVIEERSKALIAFIEKFKSITSPPVLKAGTFSIDKCFRKIELLYAKEFEQKGISLEIKVTPSSLMLTADKELVEQILINLIKNSIDAITNQQGSISLIAGADSNNQVHINVIDNGCGIAPEYLESIFIPSFTTKEHGMGIGLSLSKQIMSLHHGQISVVSNNEQTCFELTF